MDRGQLADFLRTRRARVLPPDAGAAGHRNRRTPGLRRQEVAQRADISVEYYVRLEQGRAPHPSAQVLESLTRALELSAGERAHLYHLTGGAAPPPPTVRRDVPAGVRTLVDRLTDTPAVVVDATYQMLAWNPMWVALTGVDPATVDTRDRNAMRGFFPADGDGGCPAALAREAVADLRAAAARHPADPDLRRLVAELWEHNAQFRELWSQHDVQVRRGAATKSFTHPVVGPLQLDAETLDVPDRDQRVLLLTAADDTTRHALARLRAEQLGQPDQPEQPADR